MRRAWHMYTNLRIPVCLIAKRTCCQLCDTLQDTRNTAYSGFDRFQ